MRMPWGKYGPSHKHPKGLHLEMINSGYLKWLTRQDFFIDGDSDLLLEVEKELKLRDADGSHFYEDKLKMR